MDANGKETNSKQHFFLWDFLLWKLMNANTFLLGFSILNESKKNFFVAFKRMNRKNTTTNAETKLEQRNCFYGFSVYKMEKQMQTI